MLIDEDLRNEVKPGRQAFRSLLVASGVCSLIVLDTNIVAVSLPSVARDLGAGFADIEWVVSAYMLTFAALLLPSGSIADRFGRKRSLLVGLAIFIVASLACGAAPNLLVLDIARGVKGMGSALLLTSALATIGHAYQDGPERTRAWAIWGTWIGLVITAAPALGGVITALVGWRWIFYLNLPVGLLLMWLVRRHIAESRNPDGARLDPWGSLVFSACLVCVIAGLIEANRDGWTARLTLMLLAAGGVLLVAFVAVERMQRQPMVDLALFGYPRFIGALLGMFFYAACCQVMMTLLPFYLQNALDLTPVAAGMAMLPFALAMLLFPRLGMKLSHHHSPAFMMALGLGLAGIGNLLSALAATLGGYPCFAAAIAVTGAGAGLLNADSQKNVVACVTPQRSGMASGMSATMRFTAIMVALGVYGALLGTGTRDALRASLGAAAPELATHAAAMASRMVAGDLPAALAQLPASSQPMAVPLLHQAFTAGFGILLASAGVLALLAAVLVGLLMRRPLPPRG